MKISIYIYALTMLLIIISRYISNLLPKFSLNISDKKKYVYVYRDQSHLIYICYTFQKFYMKNKKKNLHAFV